MINSSKGEVQDWKGEIISRDRLSLNMFQVTQDELLDLGDGSIQDVSENLLEMQRINDVFGGARAITRHLYPRLRALKSPIRLLDIGTGSAGLPTRIINWSRKNNIDVSILALDRSARVLFVAKTILNGEHRITLLQGDAGRIPIPEGGMDYIISSLFLHHLSPGDVVEMLRHAYRIASSGLVMSDLVRGLLPYRAFKIIQPVFARNYLTQHDGLLSIRRAYTPFELTDLARQAGLPHAQVFCHFPWRMTLVVDK